MLLQLCSPEVRWSVKAGRWAENRGAQSISCCLYAGTENQKYLGNADHYRVGAVHVFSSNQPVITAVWYFALQMFEQNSWTVTYMAFMTSQYLHVCRLKNMHAHKSPKATGGVLNVVLGHAQQPAAKLCRGLLKRQPLLAYWRCLELR